MPLVPTDFQTYTKQEIRHNILRAYGGFIEAFDSGDATSIIVGETKYRFGDDARGVNWGVYLPDQADNTEARQQISAWDDSAGDATVASMGEVPAAGETVEYYPPGIPGPDAMNEAINLAMRRHTHTGWSTLPARDFARSLDLGFLDWVEHADQIVGVARRGSPNLLTNTSFESWDPGTPAAKEWVRSGTNATVTRVQGRIDGFAAQLARSSDDAKLRQDLTPALSYLRGTYGATAFTSPLTVALAAWCKTSTASMARITIDDGPSSTNGGTLHTGGGNWEVLTVEHTFSTTARSFFADLECIDSDGNADWDDIFIVEGTAVDDQDIEHGEQRYPLSPIPYEVTLEGARPSIRLRSSLPRDGQIVVGTKQPYFTLSGETTVTDMPLEAATAFAIVTLLDRYDMGKAQDSYDRLRIDWRPKARFWDRALNQNPSPAPVRQHLIMGVN